MTNEEKSDATIVISLTNTEIIEAKVNLEKFIYNTKFFNNQDIIHIDTIDLGDIYLNKDKMECIQLFTHVKEGPY